MFHSPALARQPTSLHQCDYAAQNNEARDVTPTRLTMSPSPRKELSMKTLIAAQFLVQSFLLSPRAARLAAGALALVVSLVLGADAVDAKGIIGGGR